MRRISITLIGLVLLSVVTVSAQSGKKALKQSALDKKVDALIAKMTLEEKAGQMTEVTLDVVSKSNTSPHQLDPAKLKDAIMKYHVGSILNVSGFAYDRSHWYDVISAIQNEAGKDRLKIPSYIRYRRYSWCNLYFRQYIISTRNCYGCDF